VGVLVTNEGETVPLQSGNSALPNYVAAGHAEGKAALAIRDGFERWHRLPQQYQWDLSVLLRSTIHAFARGGTIARLCDPKMLSLHQNSGLTIP
jgi:hypothetical protein